MIEKDQAFVEFVVKELVEKPEKVEAKRSVDEMGVLIELTVDKDDMGAIIGKEGKTAKAIRTLLRVLGAKNDARVNLKIVEPEGSERPERLASSGVEKEEKTEKSKESLDETRDKEKITEESPAEEVKESDSAEATPDKEDEDERPMADLEI